jgi:nucleotide-binding universal stress UspA family protein
MTYRSLLVLLDQSPLCAVRTELAIRLARGMNARLTGWAPTGLDDLPTLASAASSSGRLSGMSWDVLRANADDAVQTFLGACTAGGIRDADAIAEDGDQATALMRQAHCNDLVVLTQADTSTASQTSLRLLVEQAVLLCGRPVLIVPMAGPRGSEAATAFDTVQIAWDDSREAARAVADALPLLRQAKTVHALTFRERHENDDTGPQDRLRRLSVWLQRHGIRPELHNEPTRHRVTEHLLSLSAELQSGLVVMGAYGHARWTEHVLGGTTQGLLASMTVPVLMSH